MEVLNEKKVTIEDAENVAETFNMMVKNAGAKDIEDYKNKSSVFFCSPLEKQRATEIKNGDYISVVGQFDENGRQLENAYIILE